MNAADADDELVTLAPITVDDIVDAMERDRVPAGLQALLLEEGAATTGSLPTIKSALGALPGVVIQDSFGGFDPPRISVRGSGVQSAPVSRGLVWTLDGLPLNAADGSFNSALIEPAIAERISLSRGSSDPAASALALGGTLALETPFTSAGPHASLALGENGYVRGALSAGTSWRDTTEWLAASLQRSDGWREHSAQSRAAFASCFTSYFGSDAPMIFVRVYAANPRLDVPGPLTRAAARTNPTSVSPQTLIDRPRRETDFARAALELQWGGHPWRKVAIELAAQTTDDWFRQLRANGITATSGEDFTMRVSARRDFGAHTCYAGVSTVVGQRTQSRFANLASASGPRFANLHLDATTSNTWLEDRWKLNRDWVITPSISMLDASRESRGATTASGTMQTCDIAGRLNARWRITDDVWLFGEVSRGVETPTFDDLLSVRGAAPNLAVAWTPLRTQRADTLEAGVRGTLGRATFEFTGYAARWHNELLRLADANGTPRGTVNANDTLHRGIESAVRWRLRDGPRPLDLALTQAWNDTRFDDDSVLGHNRLAGLPPYVGTIELTSIAEHGGFAVLGATWIAGDTFVDHANRLAYGGNVLVHARAGWRYRAGWTVFLEIDNALDRAYIASTSGVIDRARDPATTALFLPGAPRTIRAGVEWRR